jgi:putative transposase
MTNEERQLKNKQISKTKRETVERHNSMTVKTFDVKIQENKLSPKQSEALRLIFLEQKWYKNYILNWSNLSEENKISKFDTKINDITKKDKDMNDVKIHIKYLSAQSKQCLISRMCSNMKTLTFLKRKGLQKPGKLKFSKEEKIIDLKQYGISHKIISSKRIKIAGLPKTLVVNGLDQFINIPQIEFANARLLNKGNGYYVQFICYVPKENPKEKIKDILGIDFGCQTTFTLSTGEKILAKIPESERLKKYQKEMAHKVKGSKNWFRIRQKIRREYQKINNRKNDLANKTIAKFMKYETVVIQDEQISKWHKYGHEQAVQYSILGRVKSKLMQKPNVVILDKYVPTTKLCVNCGTIHNELSVFDRVFKCDCGIEMDRDIHAAQNMVFIYKKQVGEELANFKHVETEPILFSSVKKQVLSEKHEANTL